MLAAPGGGGTNWTAMTVPEMWALVENQETSGYYEMLTGWQRSYELILEHLAHMRNYRENLADAWPPEKSPASAAYITQLDGMISDLQKTYDSAVTNHTAVAGAILSLSSSRTDLRKIYDEYTSNQSKLDEFNAKPQPVQYGKVPVIPPKPPITAGQQEDLNNKARLLMSNLSTDLVQAKTTLTTPPIFSAEGIAGDRKEPLAESSGSPTPIPPAVIVDPSPDGGGSLSAASTHAIAPGGSSSVGSPSTVAIPGSKPPGLVLGETGLPTQAPNLVIPPGSSSPAGASGPLPSLTSQPLIPPGITSGPTPIAGSKDLPTRWNAAPSSEGRFGPASSMSEPASGVRPMAPGGVIGGVPGAGLGQPASTRTQGQRVNPVGGVIGQHGASTGRIGSGGAQPFGGQIGRGGKRRVDESTYWDPDNPWETSTGVAPVVLPVEEQAVDPGPAIGLT